MKKQLIFLSAMALILSGCAGKTLREKNLQIAPIKEFDEKVAIKPLQPSEPDDEAKPVTKTTPKLGIEPSVKTEVKGKKKKIPKETTPAIEDSEGFSGRRPVIDPFHVGEKVTLMITYFGVSAGDATLEVHPFVEVNGRKAYHFHSTIISSSVFSMFYKVDDFADGYLDYEQMVPLSYSVSINESKQLREVRQFFDWKKLKASFWEKKITQDNGVEEKRKDWSLTPFAQDIYSALFYIRTFQLKEGKTYVYPVSDDQKQWEVRAAVIRRETLKTDAGMFKTVVVQPQVASEGIFKPMGEVFFWYTDDDRKFPVKFEAKIKIGKLVGYLKALERGR